jgi:hypothetical protein
MLPVLIEGRALEAGGLTACQPLFASLLHGDCGAVGDVGSMADLHTGCGGEGVRVLFPVERLEPAGAVLVNVIDNPGLLLLALSRRPFSLSNRHDALPSRVRPCIMSHYVA